MKFEIYQIRISRAVYDQVNLLGHSEAAKRFPEYAAEMDSRFSDEWNPKNWKFYKHVANIEARDLSNVFEIGNIGPVSNIEYLSTMHSLSVGDIVSDGKSFWLCAPIGWKQVHPNNAEVAA
jgi:hypothetical protein